MSSSAGRTGKYLAVADDAVDGERPHAICDVESGKMQLVKTALNLDRVGPPAPRGGGVTNRGLRILNIGEARQVMISASIMATQKSSELAWISFTWWTSRQRPAYCDFQENTTGFYDHPRTASARTPVGLGGCELTVYYILFV